MRTKNKSWRDEANLILDRFERNQEKGEISQTLLAQRLGVSRQTIWRDKDLLFRLELICKHAAARSPSQKKRATLEMRLMQLQLDLENLKSENANLVQCLVDIYQNLDDCGLDPLLYISDSSSPEGLSAIKYLPSK